MTYALALWLAHWSPVDADPPPEPVVWVETGWACNGSPSGKMVDCVVIAWELRPENEVR